MLTASPSRAAPQAVIAHELPMVSRTPSTKRSAWPNAGRGSGSETMMSGLISPTTSRSMSRPPAAAPRHLSTARTSRGRAPRAAGRRPPRPPRRRDVVDELDQPREALPAGRSEEGVAGRRVERGRLGPHGAPDQHAARAGPAGDPDLALERRVVHAPGQEHPGERGRGVELRAGVAPAASSSTPGSYGNSALRTSAPSAVRRRAVSTTTRRRSSPVSFDPSRPNESGSRNRARSASRQAAATSATRRSWSAALAASGW